MQAGAHAYVSCLRTRFGISRCGTRETAQLTTQCVYHSDMSRAAISPGVPRAEVGLDHSVVVRVCLEHGDDLVGTIAGLRNRCLPTGGR